MGKFSIDWDKIAGGFPKIDWSKASMATDKEFRERYSPMPKETLDGRRAYKAEISFKRTISETDVKDMGDLPGSFCTTFDGYVSFCKVHGKVIRVPYEFNPGDSLPGPGMVVFDGLSSVYATMSTPGGYTWIKHTLEYIKDMDLLIEFSLPGFTHQRFVTLKTKEAEEKAAAEKEEGLKRFMSQPIEASVDLTKTVEELSTEKTDRAIEAIFAFRKLRDETLPDMWRRHYTPAGAPAELVKTMSDLLQVELLTFDLLLEFRLEFLPDLSLKNPVRVYPKNVFTAVFLISVDLWDA